MLVEEQEEIILKTEGQQLDLLVRKEVRFREMEIKETLVLLEETIKQTPPLLIQEIILQQEGTQVAIGVLEA